MKRTFQIADLFEQVVDHAPEDREALICGDSRLTYRQLEERANRLAHWLQSKGVGRGNHVGMYMYNCNQFLEGVLACFKIRAVPINVNYRYVGEELEYLFNSSDMVALVHGREFLPTIASIAGRCPKLKTFLSVEDGSSERLDLTGAHEYESALASASPERDFAERADDDLFIVYTGGTTGMPKGVMWPHVDLFFGGLGGGAHYHPSGKPVEKPEDMIVIIEEGFPMRSMPLAPLMHGACWWAASISLTNGHTVVLNPHKSLDAEKVWDIAEREKINGISFVGDAMGVPLLDALRANPERWKLEGLFSVGSGGAVFADSTQEGFKEFFPNVFITNTFGSSETGYQGTDTGAQGDGLERIPRHEGADVVSQDRTHLVEPGSGEQGYLARGGYMPVGYYNDPVKSAETFITLNGKRWTLTGDLATVDAEGHIVVYGRGSNCINSGGEKIFPEEVEQAIKRHPAVYDALVVGMPDERFNEHVTAVVKLREGQELTLESLQEECRKHIGGYKIPRELHVVEGELPRSPSGKPDYKGAKQIAENARGAAA